MRKIERRDEAVREGGGRAVVDAMHKRRGEKIYRRIMCALLNAGYYNISTC